MVRRDKGENWHYLNTSSPISGKRYRYARTTRPSNVHPCYKGKTVTQQESMMNASSATDPTRTPGTFRLPDSISADLARNWWAVALRGVIGILFGIIALGMPGATMLSLVLVFAAYMLVDGILAIVSAVRAARHRDKWVWLTLEGIVNIVTAAIAVLLPGLTVIAFVLLVAFWALLSGGLMLGAAFRLKMDHGRGWLIFGGIVSVIYGALLVIAPLVGALVLTWWLGVYALIFGIALLILAFKLRARREAHPQGAISRSA
jgi:uncharacterized membrane protein HdeD (DUF308 family)